MVSFSWELFSWGLYRVPFLLCPHVVERASSFVSLTRTLIPSFKHIISQSFAVWAGWGGGGGGGGRTQFGSLQLPTRNYLFSSVLSWDLGQYRMPSNCKFERFSGLSHNPDLKSCWLLPFFFFSSVTPQFLLLLSTICHTKKLMNACSQTRLAKVKFGR